MGPKGLEHVESSFEEHVLPDGPNAQVEDEASIGHLPTRVAESDCKGRVSKNDNNNGSNDGNKTIHAENPDLVAFAPRALQFGLAEDSVFASSRWSSRTGR